jgi:hypothetical protein
VVRTGIEPGGLHRAVSSTYLPVGGPTVFESDEGFFGDIEEVFSEH